ncbi:hypothetical protein FACS1894196_0700 [Clostridia bacterium]|nr:hypothetical protein FACS1894196_0670 [Clostridia bacterium]GHU82415.1 hypothetical protein FACS1894196_0700 [Clostridia bacterium]
MANFIIFMGGTGMRCAEAFAYFGACGLLDSGPVQVLLVDSDQSNGNLQRTEKTLTDYAKLRGALYQEGEKPAGILSTEILFSKWIVNLPNDGNFRLSDLNEVNEGGTLAEQDLSKQVMRALYTPYEMRNTIQSLGFFAHPNVGAAVLRAVLLRDEDSVRTDNPLSEYGIFRKAIITALGDGDQQVRVMLVGSVFGGTGASALPTLASDIKALATTPDRQAKLHVSAVPVLPYFQIAHDGVTKPDIDSYDFPLAAKSALDYYNDQQGLFHNVYLVGSPTHGAVEDGGMGGGNQKNAPMFVEWEAAMAAVHFFTEGYKPGIADSTTVHYKWMRYTQPDQKLFIEWSGFSRPDAQQRLSNFVAFCAIYLYYLLPEITRQRAHEKKPLNWYTNYVREYVKDPPNAAVIDLLGEFLRGFMEWLAQSVVNQDVEQEIADRGLLTTFVRHNAQMPELLDELKKVRGEERRKVRRLEKNAHEVLRDAENIVASGAMSLRADDIINRILRGSGEPLAFRTLVKRLYEECGAHK